MSEPTLAVDFDGVLHPYTRGWVGMVPDDEPPTPGAREFLEQAAREFKIVVFSCRARNGESYIWGWLIDHDLDRYISDVTDEKPQAVAYVDDRAVHFGGNWGAVQLAIRALR